MIDGKLRNIVLEYTPPHRMLQLLIFHLPDVIPLFFNSFASLEIHFLEELISMNMRRKSETQR